MVRGTLSLVLAGGQGERLYPLTRDRSKPAVPFGGLYRIIDFTLSNCVNSGLRQIYVLTQYKSFSLDQHLQRGWNIFSYEADEFLYRIPPQHRVGQKWYQGTADAVYQNIYLLEERRPQRVLILSGDHVYRMNYAKLLEFHEDREAQLSLCAAVVPRQGAHEFGILEVDANWKVIGFEEKPSDPKTIPGDPEHCLVNMGVYVFDTESLVRELCHDVKRSDSRHDFGRNIIPEMVARGEVHAYPFRDPETAEPWYWRDIGTLDSYYEANMDLTGRYPQFDLYDSDWHFRAWQPPLPPSKTVHGVTTDGRLPGIVEDSIIGSGSMISGGRVERSIVGHSCRLGSYSRVTESILMDGVRIGRHAEVRRCIVDKGVVVPDGLRLGCDPEWDSARFTVSPSGIVVIPRHADLTGLEQSLPPIP